MSRTKKAKPIAVEFPLTRGQFAKISDLLRQGGEPFLILGQVRLYPWSGPYKKAILRAVYTDADRMEILKRAVKRCKFPESA